MVPLVTSVVCLYVEGGDHDAESFVCGPYATYEDAEAEAEILAERGSVEVASLFRHSTEVLEQLA